MTVSSPTACVWVPVGRLLAAASVLLGPELPQLLTGSLLLLNHIFH